MRVQNWIWRTFAILCGALAGACTGAGQSLTIGSDFIERFRARADTLNPVLVRFLGIGSSDGSKVPFRFAGIRGVDCRGCGDERPPDFVVVSPSSGVTPATVVVALKPEVVQYLPSGTITFTVAFAKLGESCPACGGANMVLELSGQGPPSVTSVVNAATLHPGSIAPGEIVSIFGERLGTPPVSAQYDTGGQYPTKLGNSEVTFNGVAAPLLYVSTTQINAMVPWGVAGARTVEVVVARALGLLKSPPLSVPVADTAPGLFTVTGTGSGQGAFRSNGSLNGPNNPAPRGSVVEMWGTGAGPWSQLLRPDPLPLPFPDGSIFITWNTLIAPTATPVTVTIGGQPARIQYSGPAPFQPIGVIQVNAFVPDNAASGPQPVVLTIGQNSNARQQVTAVIQ